MPHTPTPFRVQSYEHDEYPTHTKSDLRLYGSDNLCYGILFGGDDCYPDIKKIRSVQSSIVPILNSHAALVEALKALVAKNNDCLNDILNPCVLSGVYGKHWGGGNACEVCTAKQALAQAEPTHEF